MIAFWDMPVPEPEIANRAPSTGAGLPNAVEPGCPKRLSRVAQSGQSSGDLSLTAPGIEQSMNHLTGE